MHFITDPMTIEKKSFEIIAPYLEKFALDEKQTKVYSRLIHASGDPDYANWIKIHQDAIKAGCRALKEGKHIFTDVEMVRTGINKRKLATFGGEVHCLIGEEQILEQAKADGITRSMAAMRAFGSRMDGAIVAIGNAPTALFEVIRLMQEENIRPALIVGVPVGFVGAAESKDELAKLSPVPYITVFGNKGGSPIAAAAINALIYMLD